METIGKVQALRGTTWDHRIPREVALIWTPFGAANVSKAKLKEGAVKIGLRVEAWCLKFRAVGG